MAENGSIMVYLKKAHPNYLAILAQNEDYLLVLPPSNLLHTFDETLVLEHILQVSFDGKDMTSLTGR